jgi:membrane-associated phospholipid phosphatase
MPFVAQEKRRRRTGLKTLIVSGLLLASSGLAALALWPNLDLAVAALFFTDHDDFGSNRSKIMNMIDSNNLERDFSEKPASTFSHPALAPGDFIGATPEMRAFRSFASVLPFVIYAGAILLYFASLAGVVPKHLILSHRGVIFLSLSLALGPGLLVNEVFKAHFHRPRPVHVQPFGGDAAFRPFYRADGACVKNCSFPSGETAASFWMMAPAALAPPPLRGVAVAAAILFGAATGLGRMAVGAHFLSDVLFSGLVMGLMTVGFWYAMRPSRSRRVTEAKTGLQEDLASL